MNGSRSLAKPTNGCIIGARVRSFLCCSLRHLWQRYGLLQFALLHILIWDIISLWKILHSKKKGRREKAPKTQSKNIGNKKMLIRPESYCSLPFFPSIIAFSHALNSPWHGHFPSRTLLLWPRKKFFWRVCNFRRLFFSSGAAWKAYFSNRSQTRYLFLMLLGVSLSSHVD